jgi:hypothetical protein
LEMDTCGVVFLVVDVGMISSTATSPS